MDREIFAAGVLPGAPSTTSEVRIVICRMLEAAGTEVPFSTLHEAVREYELVNYFELIFALEQMCETGLISISTIDNIDYYSLEKSGLEASRELFASLPSTIREKTEKSIQRVLTREKRLSEVSIKSKPHNGGYLMTLSLPDQSDELISFTVFAPTKENSQKIKHAFLNDPLFIYKSVMSLLYGKKDILGDSNPTKEALF